MQCGQTAYFSVAAPSADSRPAAYAYGEWRPSESAQADETSHQTFVTIPRTAPRASIANRALLECHRVTVTKAAASLVGASEQTALNCGYGFGKTRVAMLALVTFIALPG